MRRWQSEKKSNMREEQLVGKCNLQKQINQGDSEDCQQTKASNASRLFDFLLPKIKLLQTLQIKGVLKRFNGVISKSLKVPFLGPRGPLVLPLLELYVRPQEKSGSQYI